MSVAWGGLAEYGVRPKPWPKTPLCRGSLEGELRHGWTPYSDLACPSSLFPTMPRHNYRRVAPLVKALCAKHGLHYEVKPFLTALVDIIG